MAKAKAQVKGQEAARQEAELKEHGAAESHRRYAEAAQAEGDMGRKRELQHEAGIAKHHQMCAEREKSNAAASLEMAKEEKAEADKVLAAQRKRAARAGTAAAGQEAAAVAGAGGQEAWHEHGDIGIERRRSEHERREVERREGEEREKRGLEESERREKEERENRELEESERREIEESERQNLEESARREIERERREIEERERRDREGHVRRGHEGDHEGGYVGHIEEAHGEMEVDISGWHGSDRQEKKDKKRRAKQRKAESREEQRQGETSTGEEAVQETGAWRDVLARLGGMLVSRRQASAVTLWTPHRLEESIEKLKKEAAKREHNKAMQKALQECRHPAKFIAPGGDEQRMALDGSLYTASEFCDFYRDKYMVDAL